MILNAMTCADAEDVQTREPTQRELFLQEMDKVVLWRALLITVLAPFYHKSVHLGRQPYDLETMLRIHLMQQCKALRALAMGETRILSQ